MLHINSKERAKTAPAGGETFPDASPPGAQTSRMQHLWHTLRRYPIPVGALALLVVSLILWLARRGDMANWILLAVVLLGGIPLLWETLRQFARKEFSVDVIAILNALRAGRVTFQND